MSSADLAKNINKRSKYNEGQDDTASATAVSAMMPPKPKDPVPIKDPASRRRDKDRLPPMHIYVPDLDTRTWVLAPNPVVLSVGLFRAYRKLPVQQEQLLRKLVGYRALDGVSPAIDQDFLKTHLVPRLNRHHPASLRTLDWLVVDYAQEKGVAYTWTVFGVPRVVVVHVEYIEFLATHRRRHFDVFRRRHRVYFDVDGETYSTTAAQLHFFYIAYHFGILQYAEVAAKDIKAHMKAKLNANAACKAAAIAACPDKVPGRSALVGKADQHAYSVEGGTVREFSWPALLDPCAEEEDEEETDDENGFDTDDDARSEHDDDDEVVVDGVTTS